MGAQLAEAGLQPKEGATPEVMLTSSPGVTARAEIGEAAERPDGPARRQVPRKTSVGEPSPQRPVRQTG